jgi:hypothetical protein
MLASSLCSCSTNNFTPSDPRDMIAPCMAAMRIALGSCGLHRRS